MAGAARPRRPGTRPTAGHRSGLDAMFRTLRRPDVFPIALAAAGILLVTMGTRQSFGLFVSPINGSTGLGIASVSLALAIGQFAWGAIQPLAGALADRYGPRPVLTASLVALAVGCAVTPFMDSRFSLAMTLGLLASAGSGGASFSVLIGAATQRLPWETRGVASGFINAGGSFGQFVFAPLLQKLIQSVGWMGAMGAMAVAALAALPLVGRVAGPAQTAARCSDDPRLGPAVRDALGNPSYWLLHAGFFTCGFHIAFLVTHLPGEVDLCGLPPSVASSALAIIGLANVCGSLYAGTCVTRYRSKHVLAAMYASRVVLIGGYLLLPPSAPVFYVFAAGLGFTWLATVPPTASLVGKLFGLRYLGTLFGLTLLSHQIGGFLGAWLGGLAVVEFGNYSWMWYADMALAAMAALVNLPIREARVAPAPAAA